MMRRKQTYTGEHTIVDGHPDFVRLSTVSRTGTVPASLEEISPTDCPNIGSPCTWLEDMAVLDMGDSQSFSEAELRRMQLAMRGFRCLLPKDGDETVFSECDMSALPKQLEVSVQIVRERHPDSATN